MVIHPYQFSSHRIAWSRITVAFALAYALFVPAPAVMSAKLVDFLELLGFGFLVVASLGRIWCLSYIAGIKNDRLVTEGPYSVVRNPLYVLNFIGAVGFGLAIESPEIALALGAGFAVVYPAVVRQEEETLARAYGEQFARYCANTPRWLPRWANYHEPDSWIVNPRRFRAGLLDAQWFLWAFMLWEFFEESGILLWARNF